MIQRLWRLVVSHPANVISVAVSFCMLLIAFATIETRLMPDRFSGYVRGIFGFGFIVLFCCTAVAGAVYYAWSINVPEEPIQGPYGAVDLNRVSFHLHFSDVFDLRQ